MHRSSLKFPIIYNRVLEVTYFFILHQTLRAIFQYKPQNIDELMLNAGDLIFVDRTQQSDVSEGWVIGTSHRTGCRGFLPENYTERANESDTWVKHRLVKLLSITATGIHAYCIPGSLTWCTTIAEFFSWLPLLDSVGWCWTPARRLVDSGQLTLAQSSCLTSPST